MKDNFADKVAVVTGAARGIGYAIAEEFRVRGATLILVDCNAEGLETAAEGIAKVPGSQIGKLVIDLADPEAIASLRKQIAAICEHVDVLVNNAGIEIDLSFEELTAAQFDQVIAINLRAPLLVAQALAPLFPVSGGAIVNISSIHAEHAFPNSIPYACSKAGLIAQTRNLALELAGRRIRVTAVCPGYIDTPMWEEWVNSLPDPAEIARKTEALHPLGRRGLPQDVAKAVAFLAASEANWITGTCLVVDGGLTIRTHP